MTTLNLYNSLYQCDLKMHRLGWRHGTVGQVLGGQCEDLSSDSQTHMQLDTVVHVCKPSAPRAGQTTKEHVLNKVKGEN